MLARFGLLLRCQRKLRGTRAGPVSIYLVNLRGKEGGASCSLVCGGSRRAAATSSQAFGLTAGDSAGGGGGGEMRVVNSLTEDSSLKEETGPEARLFIFGSPQKGGREGGSHRAHCPIRPSPIAGGGSCRRLILKQP